ncbi:MAG: Rrf2 family transcriptional regulator [Elusimicrobia bacterium]|nr:Rrf2 family transcriptional regulator [Elusimicrobiota bacterium]
MSANSRLAVAAHILAVLASHDGEAMSSARVAQSVNTNPVVIRRILAALAKKGMVACGKGKAGGARLLRCPDQVTLWDLSMALDEEHLFAVHRNPANPRCPGSCGMKEALGKAFARAEKAAQKELRRVTVQELLRR